jgi:hypothetical protein
MSEKSKSVELVTLIKTCLKVKGSGGDSSPKRIVTQYWGKDGELVFEIDRCSLLMTIERMGQFRQMLIEAFGEKEKAEEFYDKFFNIFFQLEKEGDQ